MTARTKGPAQLAWERKVTRRKFDEAFIALHDCIHSVETPIDSHMVGNMIDRLQEIKDGFEFMAIR